MGWNKWEHVCLDRMSHITRNKHTSYTNTQSTQNVLSPLDFRYRVTSNKMSKNTRAWTYWTTQYTIKNTHTHHTKQFEFSRLSIPCEMGFNEWEHVCLDRMSHTTRNKQHTHTHTHAHTHTNTHTNTHTHKHTPHKHKNTHSTQNVLSDLDFYCCVKSNKKQNWNWRLKHTHTAYVIYTHTHTHTHTHTTLSVEHIYVRLHSDHFRVRRSDSAKLSFVLCPLDSQWITTDWTQRKVGMKITLQQQRIWSRTAQSKII